jgi:hypothetical protein
LQLAGTFITGIGLLIAWRKASNRFDQWRDAVQTRLTRLRTLVTSRPTSHQGSASATWTFTTEAAAGVARGGTTEERLARVEEDFQNLNHQLRQLPASLRGEIDDAIATELVNFQADSNAIRVSDIYWALFGVAVSISGYICQLI